MYDSDTKTVGVKAGMVHNTFRIFICRVKFSMVMNFPSGPLSESEVYKRVVGRVYDEHK